MRKVFKADTRYKFSKTLYLQSLSANKYYRDDITRTWVDMLDNIEVEVVSEDLAHIACEGYKDPFTISPAWCKEIKGDK